MKLKNKILLASASLLVLSGAAATTGAFAWYTAIRTGSVTVNEMKAASTEGSLTVKHKGDNDYSGDHGISSVTSDKDGNLTITATEKSYLVDVTSAGDGTFNKPYYVDAAGNHGLWKNEAAYKAAGTSTDRTNAYWYYSYTLTFSVGGNDGDGTYGLFLSLDESNTTLTSTPATNLAESIRFSMVVGSDTKTVTYVARNSTVIKYNPASDGALAEAKDTTANKKIISTDFVADFDTTTYSNKAKNYIGDIATGTATLDVKFYVWVEGNASENTAAGTDLTDKGNSSGTFSLATSYYIVKKPAAIGA